MAPVEVLPKYYHIVAGGSLAAVCYLHTLWGDDSDRPLTNLKVNQRTRKVVVPVWVTADFHCPWSFIARQSLAEAAKRYPDVVLEVKWSPALLYSELPRAGAVDRMRWEENIYKERLPERMQVLERAAAKAALYGLSYKLDLEGTLIGSSIMAHRLAFKTLDDHGAERQDQLVGAIYRAFLEQGRDISSPWVLAECAKSVGLPPAKTLEYLHSDEDRGCVIELASQQKMNWLGFRTTIPAMHFQYTTEPVEGVKTPDEYAEVLKKYDEYRKWQLRRWGIVDV